MSLAAAKDLDIQQMDVVSAFLQGNLEKEHIYMEQPEGFGIDERVCRLKKSLYGLKQASRVWNRKLRKFGLILSEADPCLYYYLKDGKLLAITIWVDDFLIFCDDAVLMREIKKFLNAEFKMKDLGEASSCLGFRITRDCFLGLLWLDQEHYTRSTLERFNMSN